MNIIIIDDDPIVCQSLKMIIEIKSQETTPVSVLALGQNGQEAISLFDQYHPDIVLMDIRMPVLNGIEAGKRIMDKHPQAKILYLTTFLDDEYIISALNIGAKGYLLKSRAESILHSLYAVEQGQNVFGDEIIEKLPPLLSKDINSPSSESILSRIPEKDWELVELIAQGKNNQEIANILHLSDGTVRNYLSRILELTELRDRTQLAIQYYKEGFDVTKNVHSK